MYDESVTLSRQDSGDGDLRRVDSSPYNNYSMNSPLQKEFNYFRDHHDELVRQFNGRYVVVKGEAVIGDYENEIDAITATQKDHELGTFLVEKVEPGDARYTRTFHSRATFTRPNARA